MWPSLSIRRCGVCIVLLLLILSIATAGFLVSSRQHWLHRFSSSSEGPLRDPLGQHARGSSSTTPQFHKSNVTSLAPTTVSPPTAPCPSNSSTSTAAIRKRTTITSTTASTKSSATITGTTTIATTSATKAATLPPPPAPRRMLYVLDFWERLANVHKALRTLLSHARSFDFAVVEPFMYESMVRAEYSLPSHFTSRNLTQQTASVYFNFSRYTSEKYYVPFSAFSDATRLQPQEIYVADAAAYIFWRDTPVAIPERHVNSSQKVFECRQVFRELDYKEVPISDDETGFEVAPGLIVRIPVCLNGIKTSVHNQSDPFFDTLFKDVAKLRNNPSSKSTTVLILNYRKDLLNLEAHWGRFLVPPAAPSSFGLRTAQTLHRRLMRQAPYVALHFRTGRKIATLRKLTGYDDPPAAIENVIEDVYQKWVKKCAVLLVDEALKQGNTLAKMTGKKVGYYLASDIFNDGWRYGESITDGTKEIVQQTADYIFRRIGNVTKFEPDEFEIGQDKMGLAAVVDASMAYRADRFVTHESTLGLLVSSMRRVWKESDSQKVICPTPDEDEAVLRRIKEAIASG